jgi:hypothetical protein
VLQLSTPEWTTTHPVIITKTKEGYDISGEVIEAKIRPETCQDSSMWDMHDYSVSISYEAESMVYGCADDASPDCFYGEL